VSLHIDGAGLRRPRCESSVLAGKASVKPAVVEFGSNLPRTNRG